MHQLRIDIKQVNKENPQSVQVSFGGIENAYANIILPFDPATALPAVLKVLEQSEFQPSLFSQGEIDWLSANQIIREEENSLKFSEVRQRIIGKLLSSAILQEYKLRKEFDLARQNAGGNELNLEIGFNADDKLIGAYPWELMYYDDDFLCGGGNCTLTRYIIYDSTYRPRRKVADRMNILIISPRPTDLAEFTVDEANAIRSGLKNLEQENRVKLIELPKPTFNELRSYLSINSKNLPHILHFDGHGTFGRRCSSCMKITSSPSAKKCSMCNASLGDAEPQGYLAFEGEQKEVDYKSAVELADLIRQAVKSAPDDASRQGFGLVVLSACKTAVALQGESVFNGVAQRLIKAQVPAVLAMQYRINEKSAAIFAEEIYRKISQGEPLVTAVSWGRTSLGREGDQWYRPVLYLRWNDGEGGRLFDIPSEQEEYIPAVITVVPPIVPEAPTDYDDPMYYVSLTQNFEPGQEMTKEIAVDQTGIVTDFVRMLIPAQRKIIKYKFLGINGPEGTGKSLALRRMKYICTKIQSRLPLTWLFIDLLPPSDPLELTESILTGLIDHSKYDDTLAMQAQACLSGLLNELENASRSSQKPDYTVYDPREIGAKLYKALNNLARYCTVVLLFDNCHAYCPEDRQLMGKGIWLFKYFFTQIRDGESLKIEVALTSERDWNDLENGFPKWGSGEIVRVHPSIGTLAVEDLRKWAKLAFEIEDFPVEDARSLIEEIQNRSKTMGDVRWLLDWHKKLMLRNKKRSGE